MSIKISNLHIEYSDKLVFDDVNLEVADDELVAIFSEVLDGGTSLLKGIAGFLNGVKGEVWYEGYNLLDNPPTELQHQLGYVYETNGLVSIYSVFQNISLPLQFHTNMSIEDITSEVLDICDLLGISHDLLDKRPHHLNDVQTRIVNLARALIVYPKVLLIDELEGGMSDDYLQDTMVTLRKRQVDHPMAIIITTSSDIVMNQADRVFLIKNNKLVAA